MRIETLKRVSLLVLFLFSFQCLGISSSVFAEETILLVCSGSGNCQKPRRGREDKATHLGFTTKKAKGLLTELKTLRRIDKRKGELQAEKMKVREEQIAFLRSRIEEANKAIEGLGKRSGGLRIKSEKQASEINALTLQVAKERGEKYKFLVIGFGVGVGVAVVLGVGVGVYLLAK